MKRESQMAEKRCREHRSSEPQVGAESGKDSSKDRGHEADPGGGKETSKASLADCKFCLGHHAQMFVQLINKPAALDIEVQL
jgi:hypothetical protein